MEMPPCEASSPQGAASLYVGMVTAWKCHPMRHHHTKEHRHCMGHCHPASHCHPMGHCHPIRHQQPVGRHYSTWNHHPTGHCHHQGTVTPVCQPTLCLLPPAPLLPALPAWGHGHLLLLLPAWGQHCFGLLCLLGDRNLFCFSCLLGDMGTLWLLGDRVPSACLGTWPCSLPGDTILPCLPARGHCPCSHPSHQDALHGAAVPADTCPPMGA